MGRQPCPVPFPWEWCSRPLSWPRGPPCDSGFLEEAREGDEDSPPPHPEFPQRPPECPVTAPPLPTVGSTCCLLCACPQRAPLPATSAGTLRASSVGAGTGPPSSLAWTRPCQAKHFLPFHLPMGSALGPLLAFTPLWLAAQRPICWELPCGDQGVPGGARGSPW